MQREEFVETRFVITTIKTTSGFKIRKQIEKKWDVLACPNAHIVLLSGTHGGKSGKLVQHPIRRRKGVPVLGADGKPEYTGKHGTVFFEKDKILVEELKKDHLEDVKVNNIKFTVLDVWESRDPDDETSVNLEDLSQRVKSCSPTFVICCWCFSDFSQAKSFFERLGLQSSMVLKDDLMKMRLQGNR